MLDSESSLSHDRQQAILDLTARLKEGLESRSAQILDPLLEESILWLFDHPVDRAEFLQSLRNVTGEAEDVECFILDVPNIDLRHRKAALTTRVQLVWTDSRSWEEIELNALMHLGLSDAEGGWKIDYLGFTHPPAVNGTGAAAASPVPDSLLRSDLTEPPQELSYFQTSDADLFGPIDQELSYFAGSIGSRLEMETDAPKGLVPLYIPESVLAGVIRRVLQDK